MWNIPKDLQIMMLLHEKVKTCLQIKNQNIDAVNKTRKETIVDLSLSECELNSANVVISNSAYKL